MHNRPKVGATRELRRREPALSIGEYIAVPAAGNILAYRRQFADANRYLVALNLSAEPANFHSSTISQLAVVTLSTPLDRTNEKVDGTLELHANEGNVVELTST